MIKVSLSGPQGEGKTLLLNAIKRLLETRSVVFVQDWEDDHCIRIVSGEIPKKFSETP